MHFVESKGSSPCLEEPPPTPKCPCPKHGNITLLLLFYVNRIIHLLECLCWSEMILIIIWRGKLIGLKLIGESEGNLSAKWAGRAAWMSNARFVLTRRWQWPMPSRALCRHVVCYKYHRACIYLHSRRVPSEDSGRLGCCAMSIFFSGHRHFEGGYYLYF